MNAKRTQPAKANLFEAAGFADDAPRPLADKLRPRTLAEVVGQESLTGPDGVLRLVLMRRRPRPCDGGSN